METPTLVVPIFTLSGYGDRMNDLICLSTYARVKNMKLYIQWQDFKGVGDFHDIPSWRFEDTKLSNFLNFFRLPEGVTINYSTIPHPTHVFHDYLGGTKSPRVFYNEIVSKNTNISLEKWETTLRHVKSEFGFKVKRYIPESPYAVVHLRRTDKLRGVCKTMIVKDELEFLNQETFAAIEVAKKSGISNFYIATDDPDAKNEYITFIESLGCKVINPPNIHNLLPSYFDTWMMRSSSLVIASMRYSTFSLFPCLLLDIPLWTVLPDSLYSTYEFDKNAPITYYKNVQLGN